MIECWHGVNGSPGYFPFEVCENILVPFHLVYEGEIKLEWILEMQHKGIKIMIDSGAAYYYLNTNQGYPKGYLNAYLDFLEKVQPKFCSALDFCFENKEFQNYTMLTKNYFSQITSIEQGEKRGLRLLPVVQGWDCLSYQNSATITKTILTLFNIKNFGVGSICRAKKSRVNLVFSWISEIIDLTQAHGFGQTQRTIPILKKYGLARVDTSNATGNAGFRLYCDPFGNWFYGKKSKCKPKHNFEKKFKDKKELYHFLFLFNYDAIELATLAEDQFPKNWVHPVYNNRIDFYNGNEGGVITP